MSDLHGLRPERTKPWGVLAACCLISVGVNAFVIAPSSIANLFVGRFEVPEAAAGHIVSAAIIGSIVVQIPGGYLLDRYDNRRLLGVAVAGFVVVVVTIQGVTSFAHFLILRSIGGIVGGFAFTTGANVVGEVFDADRRGPATGIFLTSPPIAYALAHATSPLLGTATGPLRVFLLHGAIAIAGLLLFGVAATDAIRSAEAPSRRDFALALGNPAVILVAISAAAAYALYLFLNTWLPTYGTDVLRLPLSTAGFATAIIPLVGIVARPAGGALSRLMDDRRRPILGGGLLLSVSFLVAIPLTASVVTFLGLVAVTAFSLQVGVGLYFVLTRELANEGTEGTSLTVMTTVAFTGQFIAPIVGGWLIETVSWPLTYGIFAGVGILGVLVLLPVSEPHAPDGLP